ncbi:FAD binding domain protein [Byssothecium circinans]|uniref:FAD binding domain protein n=1 Tax=Byssothecium circinans TaxID=147558 RepID=A0A6A5TMX1_9PLEO|nr:FAD binding domain protein [Byssothecium circinans]
MRRSCDESWKTFNKTLGGKLIKTVPIGAICHTNQSFVPYDAAKCAELQAHWTEADTHVSSPSSITAPFFANQSCDPFVPPSSPCSIGTYVQYTVNATGASDYQATIKFAKSNNIRLTIRNSAHDYLAKVTGAGAIALWTRHVRDIKVFDYKSDQYNGKAVKVGAGASTSEISQALQSQRLVAVVGNAPTVGVAGGYTQGGGHGMIASRYGMAADQTLEWEIVTADGKLLTASPSENKDLYWALGGGGGSTYGVVLSMTVKAHPDEPTTAAYLQFGSEGISADLFYETVATYLRNTLDIVDAGAGSIFQLTSAFFVVAPIFGMGKTKDEIDELVQPTINALKEGEIPFTALRTINEKGGIVSGLSVNVSKMPAIPNSVSPGWRSSPMNLVVGLLWDDTDWNANIESQRLITEEFIPALDRVSEQPPSAYMNEADPREPNWQSVFYGSNYEELLRIKKNYDPYDLFWARTAVGSESWVEGSDGRLCRA